MAFVGPLEAMVARGPEARPDVALLTFPWPERPNPAPTVFRFLSDGRRLMDLLFPFRRLPRDVATMAMEAGGSPLFEHVTAMCTKRSIRLVFIPSYFREGQIAPPAPREVESGPGFDIARPDYLLHPNQLFADPVHLNRLGAEAYTRQVASLVAKTLQKAPDRS